MSIRTMKYLKLFPVIASIQKNWEIKRNASLSRMQNSNPSITEHQLTIPASNNRLQLSNGLCVTALRIQLTHLNLPFINSREFFRM